MSEVWVVERADGSLDSMSFTAEDAELTPPEIAVGKRVVRYIPEHSARESAQGEGLAAELQKHQDLVEALQWLPMGTQVNFADLDDFLEELRGKPWRWLPRRECEHKHFIDDRCPRCGIETDELPHPPKAEGKP